VSSRVSEIGFRMETNQKPAGLHADDELWDRLPGRAFEWNVPGHKEALWSEFAPIAAMCRATV
jgi:hypothetical protein